MGLPNWTDVYPHGTAEGDEEQAFFIALSRHKVFNWRSHSQVVKESGLPDERVDELLQKYWKAGMVFQNPDNDDQWGYWERVPEMIPAPEESVAERDRKERVKKFMK